MSEIAVNFHAGAERTNYLSDKVASAFLQEVQACGWHPGPGYIFTGPKPGECAGKIIREMTPAEKKEQEEHWRKDEQWRQSPEYKKRQEEWRKRIMD